MKKVVFRTLLLSSVAVAVSACGNLSDIDNDGLVKDQPVWPNVSSATLNHDGSGVGSWPNWNNVRQIERGMNKDELYYLVGRPHFTEGLYAVREWDFAFNYREQDGTHRICQYKITFDKNMNVRDMFWHNPQDNTNNCGGSEVKNTETVNRFELNGDFLFDFDKDTLTARGQQVVAEVAGEIKKAGYKRVQVAGYTDRLGSVSYNLDLSQRRANTVRSQLALEGVTADMNAIGFGKAHQVIACNNLTGQAEKDCLRPNRRVVISTEETKVTRNVIKGDTSDIHGVGPAPYYQPSAKIYE